MKLHGGTINSRDNICMFTLTLAVDDFCAKTNESYLAKKHQFWHNCLSYGQLMWVKTPKSI